MDELEMEVLDFELTNDDNDIENQKPHLTIKTPPSSPNYYDNKESTRTINSRIESGSITYSCVSFVCVVIFIFIGVILILNYL
jgi:hypothetical protein